MKKLSLFFIVLLVISISSCGGNKQTKDKDTIYSLIDKSVKNNFGKYQLYDSVSVEIDKKTTGYLWFILTGETWNRAVLMAYKYENDELLLLDVNPHIMAESDLNPKDMDYFFTNEGNKVNLYDNYGAEYRFSFETGGVYVDAMIMHRTFHDEEVLISETATIDKIDFGRLRLSDLSLDFWEIYAPDFIKDNN
ncbi:MAG: hypothetical protein LBL90_09755 [Prevotellaceae bacterium]|jgi:hypothetical protein|nr:hypothetical protein [Prevotellaceae bacterium]